MRVAFIILIAVHGIIHLLGFLKAFGVDFDAITQPIPKWIGISWLFTFVLFAVAVVLLIAQAKYWWVFGIMGVVLSQVLIINYWSDAKFGTILNILILVPAIMAFLASGFTKRVNREISQMHSRSVKTENVVTEQMIESLPETLQKWLKNSGVVGKEAVYNVFLEQDLQMLMKPGQKEWSDAKARQYFTTEPPAFNWSVNLKMNPLLDIVGRDKFENGEGEMIIKIFSLFPIANAKSHEKVNQATMQRYLAEMVWFPSASLSPYISWEAIDDHSAKATMDFNGTKGSGEFHFDENGNFKKFVAMRYKDAKDVEPTEWTVSAIKTEEVNGIKIPVECEASWKLDNGYWTWLKLKLKHVEYNLKKIPEAENVGVVLF